MKKLEAKKEILKVLNEWDGSRPSIKMASQILEALEQIGMKPPNVSFDDSQILMRIYIDPTFNVWDENLAKDDLFIKEKAAALIRAKQREGKRVTRK